MDVMDLRRRLLMRAAGRLPSIYQEVEWIESTGTQYIDTGLYMDNKSAVRATVQLKRGENNEFYYGAAGANSGVNSFELYRWNANLQFNLVNVYNISIYSINPGTIIKTEQSINECKVTYGNETIVKQVTTLDFLSPNTLTLFAIHRNSMLYGKSRIYQLEMLQDNSPIRNFIPCYRKSDDKPGMYDTVTKTFYVNSGTGEFLVGPDV